MSDEPDDPGEMERLRAVLRTAPSPGGARVVPVRGFISAKRAQTIFVNAMAIVMEEWFGRGVVEGRLRERERIGTILRHEAALRRRDLALELALGGDKAVDDVVTELRNAPRAPEESVDTETRLLISRLATALTPIRTESEGFPFLAASSEATFLCPLTKAQLIEAREALDAAEWSLEQLA